MLKVAPKPPKGAQPQPQDREAGAADARDEDRRPRARAGRATTCSGARSASRPAADGATTTTFERPDGIEASPRRPRSDGGVIELRDRSGAGHTLGMTQQHDLAALPEGRRRRPGDARPPSFTYGQAVSQTRQADRGSWPPRGSRSTVTGHVGVGAKAETFDFALRGPSSRSSSGVEIASTGKVLKRNPTRTYRSALSKQRVPVGADLDGARSGVQPARAEGQRGRCRRTSSRSPGC